MRVYRHALNSAKEWMTSLLAEGSSFVAYRLPGEEAGYAFGVEDVSKIDISDFSPGRFKGSFVVAPFTLSEGAFALWPKAEQKKFLFLDENVGYSQIQSFRLYEEATHVRNDYARSFRKIKDALDKGVADKVVLARKMEVSDVPKQILPEVFVTLCQAYTNAFVYFFDHPEVGRWMGASPETFLNKVDNKITTVALAATQKSEHQSEDWNLKELEEQGFVSTFVDEVLNDFGISDYQKTGPEPVIAGQMVHLRTSYHFDAAIVEERLGELLKSLHPTPAVGGYPKDKAIELIQSSEHFDRGFYSGFLGPVFSNGFSFFVNIRSMELGNDNAVLYLGGGITRESKEEAEWEETRLKAHTLLSVLHSVKQNQCNESIHLR
ncbi:chorismate-binding protein [Anaerophaga thermohalophila]|uniref:chorismate-binding protein n=1 Tax=Anaerophaga thermohalophila TaxID=177400 RepID=UPI0021000262|nr:chorismate-binding protein [Anaerophaga thermohalophila]